MNHLFSSKSIAFFILFALIPGLLLNSVAMRITRPRQSFGRFLIYVALCLAFACAYTFIFVTVLLRLRNEVH